MGKVTFRGAGALGGVGFGHRFGRVQWLGRASDGVERERLFGGWVGASFNNVINLMI